MIRITKKQTNYHLENLSYPSLYTLISLPFLRDIRHFREIVHSLKLVFPWSLSCLKYWISQAGWSLGNLLKGDSSLLYRIHSRKYATTYIPNYKLVPLKHGYFSSHSHFQLLVLQGGSIGFTKYLNYGIFTRMNGFSFFGNRLNPCFILKIPFWYHEGNLQIKPILEDLLNF